MKKKLPFIIFTLLLALAIGFGIYRHFATKTRFNDDYVNGNTAGNLYNAGLFCESNGKIFFANPSDGYTLYSCDSDGSDLEKLIDNTASFINADENYVYYIRNNPSTDTDFSFLNVNTNSLCRINRDGSGQVLVLDTKPCMYASLIGNDIFYLHYEEDTATTLYKVRIDGTGKEQVDTNPYFTASADGQYFYYNGLDRNHNIWRFDTVSYGSDLIYSGNCWMPVVTDSNTLYFMDCDNNYKLARLDISTGEKTILCEDRLDSYNITGNYIYFQRSTSEPALCRIQLDGSDYTVIADGVYTDINATSTDIYFRDYTTGTMYRASHVVPEISEVFAPGK